MLSTKANAALVRLKEIEEKYKMKRKEQKWKEDADSSISSVSIVSSESKESPRKATRAKLSIKMPDTRFEGHVEEVKLSSRSERSTSDKASLLRPAEGATEIDLDVAMPLDDKSPRSAGKQESLISDIMTIQESSLIESVLDDSVIPSKSLSRSKTPRRNSSTASDRSFGREERTGTVARFEGGRESVKSSEISKGKASSNNSSITKRLRLSGKSNEKISKIHVDLKKRSIEDKAISKATKKLDSRVQDNESGSLRDDSVIEESIGTMESGSEIISEVSRTEESSVAKIEDSVLDASVTASNSSKGLIAENGYANDTFEEISSSTIRSQHKEMIDGKEEVIDGVGSSARKMNTIEYKSYQDNTEEHRNALVTALNSTPKSGATKVESRLSNYVSDFENIVNPDNVTVRSIKLSQSAGTSSENQRKRYQHQKTSFQDENVSSVSSNKNTSDSSESSTDDVTKTDERKNFPGMTTVRQESSRKEHGEASNRMGERAVIDVTGLPMANDKDWIKSVKSNSSLEEKRRGYVFEENLDQRILRNVEYVLKKLHKDALQKHVSSEIATKALKCSSDNVSEIQNASKTRKVTVRKKNESYRSSEENKVSDHNCREHNTKRKKKRPRITNSKSTGARDRTGSHKEDKALRFDGKQTRRLRKQIVELQLRQEREDLQKYLHELKDLRLESGSIPSYFRPLEFPKIAEFTQPVNRAAANVPTIATLALNRRNPHCIETMKTDNETDNDVEPYDECIKFTSHLNRGIMYKCIRNIFYVNDLQESKPDDRFRERVLAIRRWLKDQYNLYRDYCTMAQAINAHYVPTTLDDAKKTIRELRKTTIKTR